MKINECAGGNQLSSAKCSLESLCRKLCGSFLLAFFCIWDNMFLAKGYVLIILMMQQGETSGFCLEER